jgi:RHS repeat-associated protein
LPFFERPDLWQLAHGVGVGKFHCAFLTQKERDSESGLDYFINRYYSSAQGRFTSPDEPFADQDESEPQSWNLYSYVGNSPLIHTDPFGLFKKVTIDGKDYWQVESGDQEDYARLAKKTGIPEDYLRKGFGNAAFNPGELLDVSGARQLYIQTEFSRTVSIITSDQVPPSVRYSLDFSLPLPLPSISGKIVSLDTNRLIKLERFGSKALKGLEESRLVVSRTSFAELVKGSTLAKVNALLKKHGIEKFFGVKDKAAFEQALEQGLKLGLKPKDAVILATAKAQGTALATADKAIVEAAKRIGVNIVK